MRAPRRGAYTTEEQAKTSRTGWLDGFYTTFAATVMAATRRLLDRRTSTTMTTLRKFHHSHQQVSFEGYGRQDTELLTSDRSSYRKRERQGAHSGLRPSQEYLGVTCRSGIVLDGWLESWDACYLVVKRMSPSSMGGLRRLGPFDLCRCRTCKRVYTNRCQSSISQPWENATVRAESYTIINIMTAHVHQQCPLMLHGWHYTAFLCNCVTTAGIWYDPLEWLWPCRMSDHQPNRRPR